MGTAVKLCALTDNADDAYDTDNTDDTANAAKLLVRLSMLAFDHTLTGEPRSEVFEAVGISTAANEADWRTSRVRTAAYLMCATPNHQVQR